MCGLAGYSGKSKFNKDKMGWLLFLNQERGKDSVGFYCYDKDSKAYDPFTIRKYKGKPEDVLTTTDFKLPDGNLFIGHVRQATVGKVSIENAHPFKHGNIVLAMNGTTTNHFELCEQYKVDISKIDVDSEALCAMLNASQSKKPLTQIIGGCATLYTDTKTNRLYVYRNADRPLYRGQIDGDMYISSIESSLKLIGCANIKEFKQDSLYEIFEGEVINNYPVKRAVEEEDKKEAKIDRNSKEVFKDENGDLVALLNWATFSNRNCVGRYLRPLSTFKRHSPMAKFNTNNYYKISGFVKDNTWEVVVKDDDNYPIQISKYAFHPHALLSSVNSYAKLICDIYYTKGKEQAGKAGDIVMVTHLYPKVNEVHVTNLSNGKGVTVSEKVIRLIGSKEMDELMIKESKEKETKKEVKKAPLIPNFPVLAKNELPQRDNKPDGQSFEVSLRDELKLQDFGSIKELCDFTLENILNILTDLTDDVNALEYHGIPYDKSMSKKIDEIHTFIENYVNTKEKIVELENAAK